MTQWGIDVSHHDWNRKGGNLDWAAIRSAGVSFACVRLTYGAPSGYNPATQHGPELVAGARAAGIPLVGGYHNLVHGDATYIRDQVVYFLAEIRATGANWAMLDVERYEALVQRDLAPRWNDVLVFQQEWELRTDLPLAMYIARWVWDPYLGKPNLNTVPGPLVSARYPSTSVGTLPGLYPGDDAEGWTPYGGRVPDIWQYSSKGIVPGASTTTDLDAFRGTLPELEILLKGGTMRSKNMQKLTDQVKARWPGVTVYGIGDEAHKDSPSGHNEDDTPGSLPEDQDADNIREHRAIDVMIGPKFRNADADYLVERLVSEPANRARLLYVIWNGHQWRRSNGWVKEVRTRDPHRDHPHISGEADDDENTKPWILDRPTVPKEDEDMQPVLIKLAGDPRPALLVTMGQGHIPVLDDADLKRWQGFMKDNNMNTTVWPWPEAMKPQCGPDLTAAAATVSMTPEVAEAIARQIVEAGSNPLTDADLEAISKLVVAGAKKAMREGAGVQA